MLTEALEIEQGKLKQLIESKAQTERVRLLLLQALPQGLDAQGHLYQGARAEVAAVRDAEAERSVSETPVAVRLRALEQELEDLADMRAVAEERVAAAADAREKVSGEREQVLAVLAATRKRRGICRLAS